MFYVVETTAEVEGQSLPTYGIGWGGESIPDLCLEKETTCSFVGHCNTGELSVLHVRDVADDSLNGGFSVS